MEQKIAVYTGASSYTPSTLLIPGFLMNFLDKKRKEFGGLSRLFHFIVNTRFAIYNRKSSSRSGRVVYQPPGLGLCRKDFFPENEDWEKFRTFAHSQRISMTFLFVLILLDWMEGREDPQRGKKFGVPSAHQKIILIQTLNFDNKPCYLETIHLII